MRYTALIACLAAAGGCGVGRMLPEGPVLDAAARAAFDPPRNAGVVYDGPPRVAFPVLPLQVFGVYYAADVVLVSRHPDWDMHEYARIDLPEGPVWVAKDADRQRRQSIVAALPGLDSWVPEVPVPRFEREVRVEDRSEGDVVDISLATVNSAGDPVEVEVRARMPDEAPRQRNGSTMGHSQDVVAAVLDLERFGHGGTARISIGGREWGVRRLFGFYRMQFLIRQAQGGIAVTSFRQVPGEAGGFRLVRPAEKEEARRWPTHADEQWRDEPDGVSHEDRLSTLRYRFAQGELFAAEVTQRGRADPVFRLTLQPALPDLARPFEGSAESAFAMDINGQPGHGTGRIRARWAGPETVEVEVLPDAPWWLADRPMQGEVRFPGDGSAVVRMRRTDG